MGSIDFLRLKTDSSLVPLTTNVSFNDKSIFKAAQFYTFSLLPGYTYSFVHKNWYANVSLSIGVGLQHQRYKAEEKEIAVLEAALKGIGRVGVGYNGLRFFAGTFGILDDQRITLSNIRLTTSILYIQVFTGYWF